MSVMKRIKWAGNKIRWFIIGALHVITGKYFISRTKYGKHKMNDAVSGNEKIRLSLESDKPFAFGRYSYTEMEIMIRSITQKLLGFPSTNAFKWLDIFCSEGETNAYGAEKYTKLMSEAFMDADIIGIWDNLHMGDALLDLMETGEDLYVTDAMSVEPYFYDNPWTRGLEGKKVLIVSPFSQAIRYQYPRRDKIWEDRKILPEFILDTEDSVWFYAGKRDERFKDWFEAYDFLYEKIMSHDFDVAILGCGYFGFPLAARIKKAGKQAIHMGGATQILFGIKGKRWDDNPIVNIYYNDHWIRPDADLKPEDDKNLDDGCYW